VDINKKENRNNDERRGYEAGYEIGVFRKVLQLLMLWVCLMRRIVRGYDAEGKVESSHSTTNISWVYKLRLFDRNRSWESKRLSMRVESARAQRMKNSTKETTHKLDISNRYSLNWRLRSSLYNPFRPPLRVTSQFRTRSQPRWADNHRSESQRK
jgi:hypothetical protein